MSALPYAREAFLDLRKLVDYCLSPSHPRGRHKARLFRELLGVGTSEAGWLRTTLLDAVRNGEAVELPADVFGSRWRVDVPIERHDRKVMVRTPWIIRTGEKYPRFVACWIL